MEILRFRKIFNGAIERFLLLDHLHGAVYFCQYVLSTQTHISANTWKQICLSWHLT